MFARKVRVKLLDRATLQHLVHVPLATVAVLQYLVPAHRGAQSAGQVAAHHVVEARLLDRRRALVHVPGHRDDHGRGEVPLRLVTVHGQVIAEDQAAHRDARRAQLGPGMGARHVLHDLDQVLAVGGAVHAAGQEVDAAHAAVVEDDRAQPRLVGGQHEELDVLGLRFAGEAGQDQHARRVLAAAALQPVECYDAAVAVEREQLPAIVDPWQHLRTQYTGEHGLGTTLDAPERGPELLREDGHVGAEELFVRRRFVDGQDGALWGDID